MKKLTINTFLLIFITSISFSQSKTEKNIYYFLRKIRKNKSKSEYRSFI